MTTVRDLDVESAFRELFGFKPHKFQQTVADLLLNGQNVILQAPTGAGKTEAALSPYLLAHQYGKDYPNKMLYSVPMRVLAKSFHERLLTSPARFHVNLRASLQTGDQQDDRQLRSDLIFTTVDQVLSSFLNIPYSLSLRQGNVNAGAIVSSYLVFDEFHLFDPDTAMPTVIQMLNMLNGIAPFLLMTATFSEPLLRRLAGWLGAEIITVSRDEISEIPSQRNKQRTYEVCETPLMECVDAVIDQHRTRSIVICNTVMRAQEMYQKIREHPRRSQTDVLLLHSRFFRQDRKQKEDEVRKRFGKSGETDNVILVATQVTEVGLDITCETIHTEIAPACTIFQRAGRCARFENESGTVNIYLAPLMENGRPNYHPYAELSELCEATLAAFRKRGGCVLNFIAEQEVIDEVHSENDKQMLDRLSALPTRGKISDCVGGLKRELARELIRKNDSVTVLIHESPETIRDPFREEGFSFYRGTIFGRWAFLREEAKNRRLDWVFKYPIEDKGEVESRSANTRAKPTFQWECLTPEGDLRALPSILFAVHPRLAAYDETLGFRFEPGGAVKLPVTGYAGQDCRIFVSRFRKETYAQHIGHLLAAYDENLREELTFASSRLEEKLNLPTGAIDLAARLCLVLHDVGKLTVGWQGWAHTWQAAVGQPVDANCMLAHTDYDSDNFLHREKEQELKLRKVHRPPHAVESACAVTFVVAALLGQEAKELIKAVLTAIARHHAPRADELKNSFVLHPALETSIKAVLMKIDKSGPDHSGKLMRQSQPRPLKNVLVQPDETLALLTYFLLVRALRLADQCATQRATDGE